MIVKLPSSLYQRYIYPLVYTTGMNQTKMLGFEAQFINEANGGSIIVKGFSQLNKMIIIGAAGKHSINYDLAWYEDYAEHIGRQGYMMEYARTGMVDL